jgi:hypothetical protein
VIVLFAKEWLNYLNNKEQMALTFAIEIFSSSQEYDTHISLVSPEFVGAEGTHTHKRGGEPVRKSNQGTPPVK